MSGKRAPLDQGEDIMWDFFQEKPKEKKWDRADRLNIGGDIQLTVRYFCPVEGKETEIQAQFSDISEGGTAFLTSRELPVGSAVYITLRLPGTTAEPMPPIKIIGKVLRTQPSGREQHQTSVEFLDLSKANRFAIRSYITSKKMGESFL